MKFAWLLVLAAPVMAADPVVWWTGAESNVLNDWRNWGVASEAEAPFDNATARNMGFGKAPSADYTVTLTEDLACNGSWWFGNGGIEYRVTYDLGGHTLTFLKPYSDHQHKNVTNVLVNGTIAYTNASGRLNEVRVWNPYNSGYLLSVGRDGKFIGNLNYQATSPKYLRVTENGQFKGSLLAKGTESRVWIVGKDARMDGDGGSLLVGGNGPGAAMWVLDGAVATNISQLGVGGDALHSSSGDGAYLCISNAVLEMTKNFNSQQLNQWNCKFTIGDKGAGEAAKYTSHSNRMDVIGGARAIVGAGGGTVVQAVGNGYSHSNLLYVAGEGTTFSNLTSFNSDSPLISGMSGLHNRIWITDKAEAYAQSIAAGGQLKNYEGGNTCVTSMWNRVTVDGGAKLAATNILVATRHADDRNKEIYLTSLVASNLFEVSGGAEVECVKDLRVGALRPSFHNTFRASGEGTRVLANSVQVGQHGSWGNLFEATGGAKLSVTGDISIGYAGLLEGVNYCAGSSNNMVRLEGVAFTNTVNRIYLGAVNSRNNCLWIGEGSAVAYNQLWMDGHGTRVVASNGLLTVLTVLKQYGDKAGEDETSGGTFEFCGPRGRIEFAGNGNNWIKPFRRGFRMVFRVPDGGYGAAPFVSKHLALEFAEDSEIEVDLSGVKRTRGLGWTDLVRAGMGIAVAEGVLERAQERVAAGYPGAVVELSADGKAVRVKAPKVGFTIVVR